LARINYKTKPYQFIVALIIAVGLMTYLGSESINANSEHVIDELDYLSASEIDELEAEIMNIRATYMLDVVIVITDETNGQSSMNFADDYFDYNGYGINGEGILMLINMNIREVWLSTAGVKTIPLYPKPRIDSMLNTITSYLSNDDYFGGSRAFLSEVAEIQIDSSKKLIQNPIYVVISLLLGLLVGGIPTAAITFQSKGKHTVSSRTYEAKNSFALTNKIDQFTHETVTQRVIQTNTNSGGGSHTGSSGSSHGGGGKSF